MVQSARCDLGKLKAGEGTCPKKQGSLLGLYFQIGGFGGDFRAVSPSLNKGMWKSGKSSEVFKGICLRKVAGGVGGGFGLLFIELG